MDENFISMFQGKMKASRDEIENEDCYNCLLGKNEYEKLTSSQI